MLMSPMLMFLGISGRFMFLTADTARAGAPAIPAYTDTHTQNKTKHTSRVTKGHINSQTNMQYIKYIIMSWLTQGRCDVHIGQTHTHNTLSNKLNG